MGRSCLSRCSKLHPLQQRPMRSDSSLDDISMHQQVKQRYRETSKNTEETRRFKMKYVLEIILAAVMMCMISSVVGDEDGPTCGSTYIRWGKTSCAQGSNLVYSGYAGGSHFSQVGGGSNYLCLTPDPVFHHNGQGGGRAFVYGAEYENPLPSADYDYDVPCAVCESPRSAVFMQPGSDVCPTGWITEYSGWLAAAASSFYRSEFVCIDRFAENGGSPANHNGALFFLAQAVCGSLPCAPYQNNKDLSCAVCSK